MKISMEIDTLTTVSCTLTGMVVQSSQQLSRHDKLMVYLGTFLV